MKENILIEIERMDETGMNSKIIKYVPMSWPAVMTYLRDVTTRKGLTPPPLYFAKELGNIEDIVGRSSKWRLGVFHVPGIQAKKMVVKFSTCSPSKLYHKQELKILRHVKGAARVRPAPSSVARLVWDPAIQVGSYCDEFVEETSDPGLPQVQFGITPIGQPFDLAAFIMPVDFENAMDSLLDGLYLVTRFPAMYGSAYIRQPAPSIETFALQI